MALAHKKLTKLIKGVHDKGKYVCEKCKFITALMSDLNQHVKSMHDKIKEYVCEKFDYATAFKSNLNHHIKGMHYIPNLINLHVAYVTGHSSYK